MVMIIIKDHDDLDEGNGGHSYDDGGDGDGFYGDDDKNNFEIWNEVQKPVQLNWAQTGGNAEYTPGQQQWLHKKQYRIDSF